MSRFSRFPLLAAAAAGLAAITGCASNFEPIMMTRDASAVASCEKVADLEVEPVRYDDTPPDVYLQRLARERGANTVLVSDADSRTGVAYRCSMPPVATPAASGSGS